ncbi:hypothetical protein B0J18DRAFT_96287 [Chaetomium sp. MPI-SDFR-AT-0129]|nr:hypothetical protein B0J18DRAFT_96287 [Chaetomium sp. MPI-SDFR-AT-0129]
MGKSSRKRERVEEDGADSHDAKPVVKKSKLDSAGKAEITKKSAKVKEAKVEAPAAAEETSKPHKEKKEKKDKKEKKEKKEKKDKKEKKEKKKKSKSEDLEASPDSDKPAPAAPEEPKPATEDAVNGINGANTSSQKSDKDNKKKKDKKKKTSKSTEPKPAAEGPTTAPQDAAADNEEDTTTTNNEANGKANRFICFVGNLPFTATADTVRAHFATLQPISVRLLTQRDDPSKSRGIAFVEFGRYDHMKTCLEKFHHTEFVDGRTGQPRRINVELTAGGGGKTSARQDKIKQKNAKLNEERANRMAREEEAKQEKAAATGSGKTQEQRDQDAIHPSRRGRVPFGRN